MSDKKLNVGTAKLCDQTLLVAGAPCIIEVSWVNSPEGLWWGEVIESKIETSHLDVIAKITGGRFKISSDGVTKLIKSDEKKDVIPNLYYRVYPCTETTIWLFDRLYSISEKLEYEKNNLIKIKDFLKDVFSGINHTAK